VVVRALGVRYVWIDALCIVQDDDDSGAKAKDIASMDCIYESAVLTIMSAWSTDELFSSLDDCHRHKEIEIRVQSGLSQRVFVRRRLPHYYEIPEKSRLPIFNRAWIYQERILSRRVVYFTERELTWNCWTKRQCQCLAPSDNSLSHNGSFDDDQPGHDSSDDDDMARYPDIPRTLSWVREIGGSSQSNKKASVIWWEYASEYSSLEMSDPDDRLRAIQGLAARVQAKGGKGAYLAGLWEDSLVKDLCWQTHWTPPLEMGRAKPWRAPTWSWASIDAGIFNQLHKKYKKAATHAEIVRIETVPDSPQPGDMLRYGVISIKTTAVDLLLNDCRLAKREDSDFMIHRPPYTFQAEGISVFPVKEHLAGDRSSEFVPDCEFMQGMDEDAKFDVRLLKMLDATTPATLHRDEGLEGIWLVTRGAEGRETDLYERVGHLSIFKGVKGSTEGDLDAELLNIGRNMVVRLQ